MSAFADPAAPTLRECLDEHTRDGRRAESAVSAVRDWLHSWQGDVAGGTAEDGRRYLLLMLDGGR